LSEAAVSVIYADSLARTRELGLGGGALPELIASLRFADDGCDTIAFWPVDPSPAQVELLAGEVASWLAHLD
jgi:hypothetical protein